MRTPQALDVEQIPTWEREATPPRTITPADSADWFARRGRAAGEDRPDAPCPWCAACDYPRGICLADGT